jgi:glutamate/tyrosine decarboxylase-like PLP-dependent enzyme
VHSFDHRSDTGRRNHGLFLTRRSKLADTIIGDQDVADSELPVFAFTLKDGANFPVFDLSEHLRSRGWLIPADSFPKNHEDLAVIRIVVKHGFSRDLASLPVNDIRRQRTSYAAHP